MSTVTLMQTFVTHMDPVDQALMSHSIQTECLSHACRQVSAKSQIDHFHCDFVADPHQSFQPHLKLRAGTGES